MSPESHSLTGRPYVRMGPYSVEMLCTIAKIVKCHERTHAPQHSTLSRIQAHGRFPLLLGSRSRGHPVRGPLALLLMRGAEVGKLLENVGVRFQTAGRAFALGQEREAVVDHVVSKDPAIGILRRFRRIETQHVGQCALLVDLRNRFFA